MSKIEVLVFRHGETDWNRQRRFQGHTDIPLNELGREQAQGLRKVLEKHAPDVIVSSDLGRARETAEIANALLRAPIVISSALRECSLGDLEGLHRDMAIESYGDDWERWLSNHPDDVDFCLPNGETKTAHLQRMISFIKDFCQANPHFQRIAVSTHGGSLLRLVHHCQDAPAQPVPLANCVHYLMTYDRVDDSWSFLGKP
jgi:broad specificity phosphatase PhoE